MLSIIIITNVNKFMCNTNRYQICTVITHSRPYSAKKNKK